MPRHNRSELDANRALKVGARNRATLPRRHVRSRWTLHRVARIAVAVVVVAAALHITQADACRDGSAPARLCLD